MVLNPDIATLIGFAFEAVLYGIYVVLFFLSMTFLVWRRRSRDLDVPLVSATCVLCILCTAHFAIQFNHFYTHLTAVGVKQFSSETIPLAVGDFLLSIADFVGDVVLLYRCWLVYGKNYYVIAIPSLTALGGFVCGIVTFHMVVVIGLDHQQPPAALVQVGTALFTLPLCTNVIVTMLIVGRIFYMASSTRSQFPPDSHRSFSTSNTNKLIWRAAGIMIESGVLYLAAQLVLVVLFALKNPAYKVVGYPIVQIYGIAPTLIFCRVGMGVSTEQTYNTTGADFPSFRVQSRSHGHRGGHSHSTDGITTGTTAPSTLAPRLGKPRGLDGEEDFEMAFKIVSDGESREDIHVA